MKRKAKTRNVDTIRNVLVDELVRTYAEDIVENNGVEPVEHLWTESEALQKVAMRLGITFPPPARLAGLVLERVYGRI